MEQEVDKWAWCGVSQKADILPDRCGDEGAEPGGKDFSIYIPYLTYGRDLWVVTVWNGIATLESLFHQKEPVVLVWESG